MLERTLKTYLADTPRLVLGGDFNIAPADADVWNPEAWRGKILCSEPERKALERLLALGLYDSFRLFTQPAERFSWWDYRQSGFERNHGLRIDLLLFPKHSKGLLKVRPLTTAPAAILSLQIMRRLCWTSHSE